MSSVKEKLKKIFGYRKFFSSDECTIDSLVRIDEEGVRIDEEVEYICRGCILTDTISKNVGCPLIIKENLKGVK